MKSCCMNSVDIFNVCMTWLQLKWLDTGASVQTRCSCFNGMLIASIDVSAEGVHRAMVVLVNVGIQRRVMKQAFSVNALYWIHAHPRARLTFFMTNILTPHNEIRGNLSILKHLSKSSKLSVPLRCLSSYSCHSSWTLPRYGALVHTACH